MSDTITSLNTLLISHHGSCVTCLRATRYGRNYLMVKEACQTGRKLCHQIQNVVIFPWKPMEYNPLF